MSPERSGPPLELGLVGHPIGKSLSPVLHAAALAHRGVAGAYRLYDVVDEAALEGVLARLASRELDGLNVTVPHKRAAFARCAPAPLAARVGAVNTLAWRDGRIVGWNTDLPGLVAAVHDDDPVCARGGVALVVGAGGAAPAAVLAAEALGAREVRVWNRTFERAAALTARLGVGHAYADAGAAADGAHLVLQASSHGMGLAGDALTQAEAEAATIIARTDVHARVVDLVYRPRPTAWMRAAQAHGRGASDGLRMLVQQAALAFELWTGARLDVDVADRAADDLVDAMRRALLDVLSRS